MTNTNADQTDILAQLEQATVDLSAAQQSVEALQTQVSSLTNERDSTSHSIQTLTQERDDLRAENNRLKSEKEDFHKRLAAELVRHGIRFSSAENEPQIQTNKKLTADERVALAKAGNTTAK